MVRDTPKHVEETWYWYVINKICAFSWCNWTHVQQLPTFGKNILRQLSRGPHQKLTFGELKTSKFQTKFEMTVPKEQAMRFAVLVAGGRFETSCAWRRVDCFQRNLLLPEEKMEVAVSSGTQIPIYQTTRCHIPEEIILPKSCFTAMIQASLYSQASKGLY